MSINLEASCTLQKKAVVTEGPLMALNDGLILAYLDLKQREVFLIFYEVLLFLSVNQLDWVLTNMTNVAGKQSGDAEMMLLHKAKSMSNCMNIKSLKVK